MAKLFNNVYKNVPAYVEFTSIDKFDYKGVSAELNDKIKMAKESIKEVFDSMDLDKSGSIDTEELKKSY